MTLVPSPSRPRAVPLSGLWIAGIGFFVTRFTVTLAAYEGASQFFLAGIVPLVLGLSLAAFGVALVVGSFDVAYVRTVAAWCIVGTVAMLVLVVLTILGSSPGGFSGIDSIRSKVYLSTFLIGGGIGGTLTGLYAAENETHRVELKQQANRLVTLNRILRHEVLNAITVIQGRTEAMAADPTAESTHGDLEAVRKKTEHVVATIDDVKYLTRTSHAGDAALIDVDLEEVIDASVDAVSGSYPSVTFSVAGSGPDGVTVCADSNLTTVLTNLLENAARYNDAPEPTVTVETTVARGVAIVRIADDGPGLPEQQQAILERGNIPELDDPTAGFGTNVVRMFVERYGGDIHTSVSEEGTVIEIVLSRPESGRPLRADPFDVRSYGVDPRGLLVTVGAAIVAGGVMGAIIQVTSGSVPVIGTLYGVPDPLVGWIAHEFHSVVFGLVFAGLLTSVPAEYGERLRGRLLVGAGWGVFLWLFASSIVMPVWFNLLGIPSAVPSLVPGSLATHLIWGVTLALLYHAGDRWIESAAPAGRADGDARGRTGS